MTHEGLEVSEAAGCLEGFRVEFERTVRGINSGTAAIAFLGLARMRRAVGTGEEACIAAAGGIQQREAMCFALGDRQAVVMRAQAALK